MLKVLFNIQSAERHPLEMMLIGFFYASISVLMSFFILPEYSSLVMVFFTVISCLYVVQNAVIAEELKDRDFFSEKKILMSHARALKFLLFLFLGFVFAFTFWTIVLPVNAVSTSFNLQSSALSDIKFLTGNVFSDSGFYTILINNFKVAFISFFLALFYGAGAIFILVWNASVMGFVIGDLARNTFGLSSLPIIASKSFLHGILEMAAYFTSALAGGILFVSLIKEDLVLNLKKILLDVALLIFISVSMLVIAALIECYITPIL
jgi:uncharacterized membrane protein SpoIIM required for sporulation